MVFFNYALRKLNAKIVYYGPGLCGKTTNLQWIHDHFEGGQRGKMISLSTEGDRTIFFDLLPLDIGEIRGMEVTLQLYTVPGQVHYNSTRQLVLRGADGVVFVADSQATMRTSNIDSLRNLEENLSLQGVELESFPHVLQFNKRDLGDLISIEQLDEDINTHSVPFFEAVATEGVGVQETLEGIVKLVMRSLRERYEPVVTAGAKPPAEREPLDVEVPPPPTFEPPPSVVPVSPPPETPAMAEMTPPAPIGMQDDVPTEVYADGRPQAEEEEEAGLPGAAFWDAAEDAAGPTFGEADDFDREVSPTSDSFGFAMPFADNETTTDVTDVETGRSEAAVDPLQDAVPLGHESGGSFAEVEEDEPPASPFEVADLTPEPYTADSVFGEPDGGRAMDAAPEEEDSWGVEEAVEDEVEATPAEVAVEETEVEFEAEPIQADATEPETVDDLMASVLASEMPSAEPEPDEIPESFADDIEAPADLPEDDVPEPDATFEAAPESEIVVDDHAAHWATPTDGDDEPEVEPQIQATDEVDLEPPEDATDHVADAEFDGFESDGLVAETFDVEVIDESVEEHPISEEEWNEAHTDEIAVDEPAEEASHDVASDGFDEAEIPMETEAAVELPVEEDPVAPDEELSEPSPFTIGEGDPFGDEVDDQQTPVRAGVEPQVSISAPVVDSGDAMVRAGDNQLHLRLQGTGAIAESGQVRALDIEVPVPGSWVGNRRVTLQLRLTLTPAAEEEDGGPGDTS